MSVGERGVAGLYHLEKKEKKLDCQIVSKIDRKSCFPALCDFFEGAYEFYDEKYIYL
jgi:hypothetical protein